jgi:hypothetical protein
VFLSRVAVEPGSSLSVEIVLDSEDETPVDFVELTLRGTQRTVLGAGRGEQHRELIVLSLGRRETPGVLHRGETSFRVRFDIPAQSPPSYRGVSATVVYELGVHVSIPWWPDRRATFDIRVAVPPVPPRPVPPLLTFGSSAKGAAAEGVYIEASLDRVELAPGGVMQGAASFSNVAMSRVRSIELAFVLTEHMMAPWVSASPAKKYSLTLVKGAPAEGQPIPFKIRLPPDAPPGFAAALFRLSWRLEIRAVVLFGDDVVLRIPIEVVPAVLGEAPAAKTRVAPVGRERRAIVWAGVAERLGLENDPEHETMRTTLGASSLVISLLQSGEVTSTVARFSWPSLGLDLRVSERAWSDVLGHTVDLTHAPAAERLIARGREDDQVRSWLGVPLEEALVAFEEVRVDDDGATLTSRGAAHSLDELLGFVKKATELLRLFQDAAARVAPPRAMAAHLPAWQSYAARTQGRLELGRMWIHGATIGVDRFEVQTLWRANGVHEGTVLRFIVDPPLDRDLVADDPSLSPEGRALLAELATKGTRPRGEPALRVHRDAFEWHQAPDQGVLEDPATLDGTVEALARLARAARGIQSAGPFR